ncbi:MAG TPA: porphobilinogen synthase [Thermoplasmata archaeon]|nr:porphobilinogen synthase [Thermoplasmata archaeon]
MPPTRRLSAPTVAPSRPFIRARRLRATAALRRLAQETRWDASRLVYPLFVHDPERAAAVDPDLPALTRRGLDATVAEARRAHRLGIPAVLLFGVPDRKTADGHGAHDPHGIVPRTVQALKQQLPSLLVITDVCLCGYTTHGHCGLVRGGTVDNDRTLPVLARMAVTHARAGADLVAPSAMMDHQVAALRGALDVAGFDGTGILAYSAKFASAYYGPFREAADSAPAFGDRRSYQMAAPNAREAIREIATDVAEGADIVMVKPAQPYLDVLARARPDCPAPLAAFQVSGEYAQIRAAARHHFLDEKAAIQESLTGIFRAGADLAISYFAPEAAGLARESRE